ncbi:hypothetical protein HS1genome_0154 [Sulfodiicoccus acidiphilus]|uniref:DedA family protein n=1 Tax=Sulfodiicoccus acidiphilus TaxID=1670455 RepID=A0A348B0R3_9CREN|nr:hypothetical protein [Sulfodiicoccus acidiphilus]BBD71765.1 hypothetical protein HS1genome_0154 [Sulfodiicoccus acidiphilus]GGT99083.1 hypothetical protein GCM10007116_15490 [Sulfodiicoccus acidiphilus]
MGLIIYLLTTFLVSFLSNATPFFGAPYTLVTATLLAEAGVNPLNFVLFVTAAALAASTSKLVMYVLGVALKRPLTKSKNIRFISKFVNKKSFYVTLFVLSIIPFLPLDDYVFIVGGASDAKVGSMLAVSSLGKLIKTGAEVTVELEGLRVAEGLLRGFGLSYLDLGLIGTIAFVVIGLAIAKLDWENIYRKVLTQSHREGA